MTTGCKASTAAHTKRPDADGAARVGAQSNRSYLGWTVDAFDLFILVFVMDDITLSFCDVADLLAELGILVSYDKAMRQGALNLSTMPLVMVSATLLAARSGEFAARNSMSGGRRAGCYSGQV